jgi:hypothetical protein
MSISANSIQYNRRLPISDDRPLTSFDVYEFMERIIHDYRARNFSVFVNRERIGTVSEYKHYLFLLNPMIVFNHYTYEYGSQRILFD